MTRPSDLAWSSATGSADPKRVGAGLPVADPLAARLFPFVAPGIQWGLERMEGALAELGHPHRGYPALQVGGTNGKGSVATVWASVLQARGFRVGLYTSPHLCSFRERFLVGGRPASIEALEEAAREIRPVLERHRTSFFESATVLALHLFRKEGVDVAVAEVGLGGRMDATRVLNPIVTAVTNVGLDHQHYLGGTLGEIAREKAGIARPGIPFLTAETRSGPLAVLEREARSRGAPFLPVDPREVIRRLRVTLEGTSFRLPTDAWGTLELETRLSGFHQAANVTLAVRALELMPPELAPGAGAVVDGVRAARHPGRLQVERDGSVLWILDVAHNPAGARALARTLRRLPLPRPVLLVTGVLGDKDWRRMLPPLFRLADGVYLTVPDSAPEDRRWDPHAAARAVSGVHPGLPLEVEPVLSRALERARAGANGGTVVVTGSCATVGDALRALGREPWPGTAPVRSACTPSASL